MDRKLLMDLSAIGAQQAAATEYTDIAIHKLIYYFATYTNSGIIYRTSDMIMCAHSYAAYLNESKACSQAVSFIFLSEYYPIPRLNGPALTLSQILKFVVSSAAKAKMTELFITAKNMIPLRQTFIEMA